MIFCQVSVECPQVPAAKPLVPVALPLVPTAWPASCGLGLGSGLGGFLPMNVCLV